MSDKHELATVKGATGTLTVRTMDDLARLGNMLAQSGFFADAREAAQAGVKVLAGLEMGIGAFSAMTGIHLIQGRPSVGANLMAARVKASGKYDYRVRAMTDKLCEIEFYQGGESIGVSSFSIEEAKKAGTKNLDKFPKNMLFARAMSNGVRWFCPDVFTTAVYTPEELGASVDGDGNVVTVQSPAPQPEPVAEGVVDVTPEPEASGEAAPPLELGQQNGQSTGPATAAQRKAIAAALKPHKLSAEEAQSVVEAAAGRSLPDGSASLTLEEGERLARMTSEDWAPLVVDFKLPGEEAA